MQLEQNIGVNEKHEDTGEKILLDFQDADIVPIFRLSRYIECLTLPVNSAVNSLTFSNREQR